MRQASPRDDRPKGAPTRLRRAYLIAACLALTSGCGELVHAPLDRLAQPTGMALSPRGGWLLVANGDWQQERDSSSIVALDLAALESSLADPAAAGASLDGERPCRSGASRGRIECDPRALISEDLSVRTGRGVVNMAMAPRSSGKARALVPTRIDPALTWIDVEEGLDGRLTLECRRDLDRFCQGEHVRTDVGPAPARISIDEEGFAYAYLPQVLQDPDCTESDDPDCSGMTLIDLDAAKGPRAIDYSRAFFREDPLFNSGLGGGFAVAQRACDPEAPADLNRNCNRPLLYASQRHWFGIRLFTVAPGTSLLLANLHVQISGPNVDAANPLPLNGDLAFMNPEQLVMVHTTPPALSLVDTSLDEADEPLNEVRKSVPLCANPNILELWQPEGEQSLAFVSCFGDARVNVVALDTFSPVRTLNVGEGPNEMLIDPERRWLFVANVLEDSLSIVSLDPTSPDYLREFATVGLGTERETSN